MRAGDGHSTHPQIGIKTKRQVAMAMLMATTAALMASAAAKTKAKSGCLVACHTHAPALHNMATAN